MANANGWGDGASNNNIGWGQGANNAIGWGDIHADSWAGLTDIVGITTPPVDPDAQAFITAAAITDSTQQGAINTLVVDLKGYSLWTKMKAIYPVVGGSASAHAVNLKTPGTFNLSFSTGWTHSSNGALPNGTSAYADTSVYPNVSLSQNSTHISCYIRTNNTSNEVAIGSTRTGTNLLNLFPDFSGSSYFRINSAGDAGINTGTGHLGFWLGNRNSSTQTTNRRNSTLYTNTTNSTGLDNNMIKLANILGYGYYANQFAFASIGDGLTNTEAANFYTAVQAYQTTLSRQV
jgi:hypothetical protein